MQICIDYDDTYTLDPKCWDMVILIFLSSGHNVWCVSARHQERMDEAYESIGKLIGSKQCIGTNGVAKRTYLFENHGVYGDVWIDDMPETVTEGYDIGDAGLWVPQFIGKNVE